MLGAVVTYALAFTNLNLAIGLTAITSTLLMTAVLRRHGVPPSHGEWILYGFYLGSAAVGWIAVILIGYF